MMILGWVQADPSCNLHCEIGKAQPKAFPSSEGKVPTKEADEVGEPIAPDEAGQCERRPLRLVLRSFSDHPGASAPPLAQSSHCFAGARIARFASFLRFTSSATGGAVFRSPFRQLLPLCFLHHWRREASEPLHGRGINRRYLRQLPSKGVGLPSPLGPSHHPSLR